MSHMKDFMTRISNKYGYDGAINPKVTAQSQEIFANSSYREFILKEMEFSNEKSKAKRPGV